ncbi:MAG: single-stranded-DNA-specific exonuclease [Candidatus Diapherotrites archaeon]|nr:single-stranded-DNA-specific exonuclease [Candidatus Diapherotrites archaeon]
MDGFLELAKRIANVVRGWDDVVVVGHYDADGITSTAILVSALEQMGKEVRFINLKQLYTDDIERIQDMGEHFIFADLGVGQLPTLRRSFGKPFVVLDHHQIPKGEDYPLLLHPHFFGLDGAHEISGAGVAYALARVLTGDISLAPVAVVGAVGDVQLVRGALTGYNRDVVLRDAIASGKVFAYRDLALYGRASRPLPYMFVYSSDPVLPGLTANEDAVFDLLRRAGIEYVREGVWISYVDLNEEEKRRLFTELALYLSRAGWSEEKIAKLIGEVYELTNEDLHSPLRDVREYATLLNACGRHGRPEVGVHVAMGDRDRWYSEALKLLHEHREALRRGIEWVEKYGIEDYGNFYFFHARSFIPASLVGIVAGMVYGSGIVPPDRPIVGMAYEEEGFVKVSARASSSLVRKGLDLAEAMRRAAAHVGGEAGGHRPAAGARIPRGAEEEFLRELDEVIGEQLT